MAYRNCLIGLAMLAGAAHAQTMPQDAARPAPVEPTKPAAVEKKQCRSEAVTGSMMPHRTCRTRAEWQAIDTASGQAGQDGLGRMRQTTGLMTTR